MRKKHIPLQHSFSAGGAIGTGLIALLIAQGGAPLQAIAGDTRPPTVSEAIAVTTVVGTRALSARSGELTTTIDAATLAPAARLDDAPAPSTAPSTTPRTTATPTTAPPTTAASLSPGASPSPDAVALTNQQRQAAGLPALTVDSSVTAAAAQHSADQAERNSTGHTGSDGSSAGDRVRANGGSFGTWGENVAAGYDSAYEVVEGWMNSPGHRRNILNPSFTRIGVAAATSADGTLYWTMVLTG